jgi:hypothetical protein
LVSEREDDYTFDPKHCIGNWTMPAEFFAGDAGAVYATPGNPRSRSSRRSPGALPFEQQFAAFYPFARDTSVVLQRSGANSADQRFRATEPQAGAGLKRRRHDR